MSGVAAQVDCGANTRPSEGARAAARPGCCAGPAAGAGALPLSWWRLTAGLFLAGNSMVLSLAVNLAEVTREQRWTLYAVVATMAAVVVALAGGPLGRQALGALRARRLGIEALFACGLAGALGLSIAAVRTGRGAVYFETVGLLVVIFAWGQQLKTLAWQRVHRTLGIGLPQATMCRRRDVRAGAFTCVPVADIVPGDEVAFDAGEIISIDGIVRQGHALVDTAAITGESVCTSVGPGERVMAGMHTLDGALHVEASVAGCARHLDVLMADLAAGLKHKSSVEQHAETMARLFVPVVVGVALSTALFWALVSSVEAAMLHGMAVLLVACPCALSVATPTAMWAAMVALARYGYHTRHTAAIERLAAVDTVVFDKTGTLTAVDLQVSAWAFTGSGDDDEVVAQAAATQAASAHPLARAFRHPNHACAQGFTCTRSEPVPGAGIEAQVRGPEGARRVAIGDGDALVPGDQRDAWAHLRTQLPQHLRPIAVVVDGKLAAIAGVGDRPLPAFGSLVATLEARGLFCRVFSGDRAARLAPWAAAASEGSMQPLDKVRAVRALNQQDHRVCFVGDGINDAAAMAQSHVSMAIDTGASLAVDTADFTLPQTALGALAQAVDLARASVQLVRSNLRIAACYNLAAMSVAAAGLLHPAFAAGIMLCSSLFVTLRPVWVLGQRDSYKSYSCVA